MSKENSGLIRSINCRLRKLLKGKNLELALQAVAPSSKKVGRLPKDVSAKVAKMAQEKGSAMVVYSSRSGKWRVYSSEGYKAASDNALKNQPWKHKAGSKTDLREEQKLAPKKLIFKVAGSPKKLAKAK